MTDKTAEQLAEEWTKKELIENKWAYLDEGSDGELFECNNAELGEKAYLAGYEQGKTDARKWISVRERLPHQIGCSGPYLVWYQEQANLLRIQSGIGLCDFDAKENPCWSSNLGHHVTHWMPLPKKPKDRE